MTDPILNRAAAQLSAAGEAAATPSDANRDAAESQPPAPGQPELDQPAPDQIDRLEGLTVRHISFEGVAVDRLAPLPGHLPQAEGEPLSREKLKGSLRQLFATGLFEDVQVEGSRDGDVVDLVFRGAPRAFIGTVSVDGAKGATLNTQLQRASQLSPGSRYTPAKLDLALAQMNRTLADNGFNQPTITHTLTPHPQDQLVDIAFQVVSGPQARVGGVQVTGDPGISTEEFRRHAHL
ncbi:MAG: POTRA domain-containing protein, partial [Terracidiphilus sp.]